MTAPQPRVWIKRRVLIPCDEFRPPCGEIARIVRESRLILPHSGEEISIGDRELRDFQFPELETNKILFIEKDGLWQTLKQTGGIEFARRHDMAILAGQGFATVAMRKLLALASAHDWQAFAWHDADPSGYEIYRTLTEETRRMPDHRIDVFDLGLTVADAQEMGLPSEPFIRKKAISKGTLDRLTSEEKRLFGGVRYAIGGGKFEWRCERFEINAIPVRKRVDYLERKLAEIPNLSGKVVPSDDRLPSIARDTLEERILSDIRSKVERRIDPNAIVAAAFSRLHIPEAYDAETKDALKRELDAIPEATWRHALRKVVAAKDIARDKIDEAIDAAIEEVLAQKWREADG